MICQMPVISGPKYNDQALLYPRGRRMRTC